MPELPEAETIVQHLRGSLPGRRIESVDVLRSDLVAAEESRFRSLLPGRTVSGVRRRGKNPVLWMHAAVARDGARKRPAPDPLYLTVNLGMSGRLLHRSAEDDSELPSHRGLLFRLDDGSLLIYADVRRFGRLRLLSPRDYRAWSGGLGPEPLSRSFTGRRLSRALSSSASPVRSWLLDQRKIAGVGNIYANEALFLAGLHPRTAAMEVLPEQARNLHRALRSVLRGAIASRGTTLRDYRTATGEAGSNATNLRVYGRDGERCPRCGSLIERIVFGGRSAFFCTFCQPEPTQS